jgi:hypothetical protein
MSRYFHTRLHYFGAVLFKLVSVFLVLCAAFLSPKSQATDKLTIEQVLAKHLESIGSAQNRKAVKTRIISGTSFVTFRTAPTGQASGKAVLASDGAKSLIGMSFYSPVYPRERFTFDGSRFMAAFVTPGVRSSLGSFLMIHDFIFKQGLMGGTLSSAWPLLDLSVAKARLEYAGLKRINEQSLHEVKYQPKNSSDVQVSIFFDEVTFAHVRTEYMRLVPAETGNRSYSNITERESRYKLVEEFSNFRLESGLNLPHKYKVEFAADTQSGTFLAEWTAMLSRFIFNDPIDPAAFSIN